MYKQTLSYEINTRLLNSIKNIKLLESVYSGLPIERWCFIHENDDVFSDMGEEDARRHDRTPKPDRLENEDMRYIFNFDGITTLDLPIVLDKMIFLSIDDLIDREKITEFGIRGKRIELLSSYLFEPVKDNIKGIRIEYCTIDEITENLFSDLDLDYLIIENCIIDKIPPNLGIKRTAVGILQFHDNQISMMKELRIKLDPMSAYNIEISPFMIL
ncbi:MAG: hypothetical protein HeimC2_05660 [Candidatus Heimdallarchaeota archaeon LC_2]|nr:MAG: hypothetical protein HeimC2_05660 [Candidatus Heimdallarchaeota archaeon LC_2]